MTDVICTVTRVTPRLIAGTDEDSMRRCSVHSRSEWTTLRSWLVLLAALVCVVVANSSRAAETQVPVNFSGGHDTDARDHGRPVALVAGALGVKPEVFREAFSGVRPAKNGKPSGEEARKNKEALMKVLQ